MNDDPGDSPLGLIEAKRTAVNPELGRTQAKCYADGIEKERGQRPVIFYSNGFDTWIWDDAGRWTPRKLYGFYSKDSLQHLVRQRSERQDLTKIVPSPEIAGRLYQIRAVTEVLERFQNRRRKALIVQSTGTGKTRVAISFSEALIRAGWVKRILFLCDRRELRKQAHNAFKAFLPDEPRVYVTSQTYKEREHRIYLATYPAMMKCYETFDVGFFDLIIADESHRSIYNRYRDLLYYFDSQQVGLTATPRKDLISHNTYRLFDCEDNDPTSFYSYEDAINDVPAWLVPFEVHTYTTPFLRRGVKYTEMTPDQRRQLEEDETEPEAIQYEQREVDKHVFNKDTNRHILRNLMEQGITIEGGSRLGKTIIFARNHNHAVLLQQLFDEMYPQYGGMVEVIGPKPTDVIGDPACGTGGFLAAAAEHVLRTNTSKAGIIQREDDEGNKTTIYTGDKLNPDQRRHLQEAMFFGFDFDVTMLRIASMNLILHGLDDPNIHYCDSLSNAMPERFPKLAQNYFDVILANSPFKGSLDFSDVHTSLTGKLKTKKTELLFLVLMLRMLKTGGRCAVIVPDGVLFGSSTAHRSLRQMLVDDNQLEAVISLPAGVFKPYAGVSTAVLVFARGGRTDNVFYYDVERDGFSLDDKRTPLPEKDKHGRPNNDLPDVVERWRQWDCGRGKKHFADRKAQAFFVPRDDIAAQEYDLSIGRYKEHVYEEPKHDPPQVILDRLKDLEKEIAADIRTLEKMLG